MELHIEFSMRKFSMRKVCDLLYLPIFLIPPKVLCLWFKAMSFFSDLPSSLPQTCLYRPFKTGASRRDIDRMLSWCRWFEGGGRWCDGAVGSQVKILNLSLHPLNLFSSMMQGKFCLCLSLSVGEVGLAPL